MNKYVLLFISTPAITHLPYLTQPTLWTLQVAQAEARCASKEEMITLLGKRRSKIGMFEGDLVNGELEIGQVAAHLNDILPAKEIVDSIWEEFCALRLDPLRR